LTGAEKYRLACLSARSSGTFWDLQAAWDEKIPIPMRNVHPQEGKVPWHLIGVS
jgi:hypothetical protein